MAAVRRNHTPERAGAYLRISDDRSGEAKGVGRQEEDARARAHGQGWEIKELYVENDTSAYKKRKRTLPDGRIEKYVHRPEFRRMLDDYHAGVIDGIVVYDLDRLARQPRDLEDLIDLVEEHGLPVMGISSEIDLMTSGGRMAARMMVAVALKSSEDTARRVRRQQVQNAQEGIAHGGPRKFAYTPGRKGLVEAEAVIGREIFARLLNRESRYSIVKDLVAREVPTVNGKMWGVSTLTKFVQGMHIAGFRTVTYRDEETGEMVTEEHQGDWPVLVSREDWDKVQVIIKEQHRKQKPGYNAHRYLLSGIAHCGECGNRMFAHPGGARKRNGKVYQRKPYYYCWKLRGGCGKAARQMEPIDALVERYMLRCLGEQQRPKGAAPDTAKVLGVEIDRLEKLIEETRHGMKTGLIDSQDGWPQIKELREEVSGLKARYDTAIQDAARATPEGRWQDWTLDQKREAIRQYAEMVMVHPAGKSGPGFDPDLIEIIPAKPQ